MNVREGAGTNYKIKDFEELTENAKNQGGYIEGVIFTALEVKNLNNESWARTPSGWVCLYMNNEEYCQKI